MIREHWLHVVLDTRTNHVYGFSANKTSADELAEHFNPGGLNRSIVTRLMSNDELTALCTEGGTK